METSVKIRKLKQRALLCKIFGYIFIGFQIMGSMGSLANQPGHTEFENSPGYKVGYFIGSLIWLYLAIFLFYRAYRIKKNIGKLVEIEQINSIGQ